VTLSGSLPPGVPAGFYAELIAICRNAGVPVLLDASKDALKLGLAAKPTLIKPNKTEFATLIGQELHDTDAVVKAARTLAQEHGTLILVSLGADGAVIVSETEAWQAQPPDVPIRSAVGSGDSLVAGVAAAFCRGYPLETAIRYGVAAGTANALEIGAGVFNRDDFERILPQVTVTPL
jgi:1-phosphofructokinase family hexose kinase